MKGSRGTVGYLVVGAIVTAGYFVLPSVGPWPEWAPRLVIDWCVTMSALVALAVGIARNKPGSRWPWLLLIGSHACFVIGDILFYTNHYIRSDVRFPAVSDVFYLGQYPLLIAGLFMFVRRRNIDRDRAGLIDAMIIGTGAALLSWMFIMSQYLGPGSGPGVFIVGTSLAYPLMDIVVLAVALRLVTSGLSRSPSFIFLVASIAMLLASDSFYAWSQVHGTYKAGGFIDGTWLVSYLLLAAAALHPSMRSLTEPVAPPNRSFTRGRRVLLTLAALLAPMTLLVTEFRQHDFREVGVGVAAGVLLLLVLARLADAMRVQQRVIAKNRRLEGELRQRHSELKREQEFLHATLNSMNDAIVAADVDGNVTLFHHNDDSVLPQMGESENVAAVVAKLALYRPDGTTRLLPGEFPLLRALGGEHVSNMELVVQTPGGSSRFVLASAHPTYVDGAVSGAVAAFHDISERKRLEEAALAQADAERVSRTKSEFLSRVSHELRTPLNAILGFGQLLELGETLSPRDRENVAQMMTSGRHLLSLIDEVLNVSRIESGSANLTIADVDVRSVAAAAVDMLAPLAAEREIAIGFDMPSGLVVSADAVRLREVLVNLVSNAVKYNVHGGSVTVAAEVVGKRLHLHVSDTGPGIARHLLPRLFLPFDRLGAEQTGVEGTGLGLTLSKAFVEAMGASITVDSEPGIGSTFTVDLPRVELESETADAAARRPCVLCIEDNPANLALIRKVFELRAGVELVTASTGTGALALARSERPKLVLLDLNLPGTSGQEVLSQLRIDAGTRDTPVVIVSADASPGTIARLRAAGATDYLTKPIDIARLLEVVDEALAAA